jgi:hypothetical protein
MLRSLTVLHPALAQNFIRQVVHVFEDCEAGHQPPRQWRVAGAVGVNRPEGLLSVTRASFASGWFISTIWSNLARNDPAGLSRRSLRRMPNHPYVPHGTTESSLAIAIFPVTKVAAVAADESIFTRSEQSFEERMRRGRL